MNFDWKVGEVDAETWCYEDLGMLTYMLSQALWNLNFFSYPLRWDQQERNCSYDYIHRSICKDHKVFFNLYILNLFHKSGLREGRGQFHHCRGLKRYFWLKFFFFFPSWNTKMYMLVWTAWLHISCIFSHLLPMVLGFVSAVQPSAGPQEILSFVMEFFAGFLSSPNWHTLAQSFN